MYLSLEIGKLVQRIITRNTMSEEDKTQWNEFARSSLEKNDRFNGKWKKS